MATVRIYKVAELLGATSQEVLQLLKQNHGIELKSASSTLEALRTGPEGRGHQLWQRLRRNARE